MTRATKSRGYRRGKTDGKRKRVLLIAGSVLALALVVWLSSALSTPDSVDTTTETASLTPVERSQSLFDDALRAIESGETTVAADLLREALALDPDNSAAASELKKMTETDDPAVDPVADPADDPADDPAPDPVADPDAGFTEPVADMKSFLPASIDGFSPGTPLATDTDVAISYDPTNDGPIEQVARVLIAVHDRGSVADAQRFVTEVSKVSYGENASTITVDGIQAYFGTDGRLLATVVYTRGRFAFEVVVTTEDVPPSTLKAIAIQIAAAFPDSL